MKRICIAASLCTVLALAACGGGSDEAQIRTLVDEMFAAMKSGDFNKMKELSGDDHPMAENEEAFKMVSALMQNVTYQLSDIKIDGDNATAKLSVTMEVMGEKQTQENDAVFERVDGKWRAVR